MGQHRQWKAWVFIVGAMVCLGHRYAAYGQCYAAPAQQFAARDTAAASFKNAILTLQLPKTYTVPPDQYTRGFGFFCKQELKWQKAGLPIKVRAGNPGDCDHLEQKTGLTGR